MLEKFDNQKLSDEALDDVTGGGFISDLLDHWKDQKKTVKNQAAGEKKEGWYKCACGHTFEWKLDTDPVCPKCTAINNAKRISNIVAVPFGGKMQ